MTHAFARDGYQRKAVCRINQVAPCSRPLRNRKFQHAQSKRTATRLSSVERSPRAQGPSLAAFPFGCCSVGAAQSARVKVLLTSHRASTLQSQSRAAAGPASAAVLAAVTCRVLPPLTVPAGQRHGVLGGQPGEESVRAGAALPLTAHADLLTCGRPVSWDHGVASAHNPCRQQ